VAQWTKGTSGNPAGKPKGAKDLRPRKRRSDAKTAPTVDEDFMPPATGRVKGFEDGADLKKIRNLLNRDPAPLRTGPEFRASVKQPVSPKARLTTFAPEMESPLDPVEDQIEDAQERARLSDPLPEYDDPNVGVKMDETLRDIIDAARQNRRGYTGDDPNLKPITFRRAFNSIFAAHFGAVLPDGAVIPRNDPRFTPEMDTWYKWLVLGLAIFAEKMTRAERAIYFEFTGRKNAPTKKLREVWVALARRSGKNHFFAAVIVFVACLKRHNIRRGNTAKIMLLALDREQSGESFRMIADLLLSIPQFAAMIVGGSTDRAMSTIKLANRIEIQIMVANQGSVRARAAIFILLDEVGHWQTKEGAVNIDAGIVAAIRPTRWGMTESLLVAISSPRARKGELYRVSKQWGIETVKRRDGSAMENPILYWQARTDAGHVERVLSGGLDMRPTRDQDFLAQLEADYIADPASFVSEGLGQFRADLETYVSLEVVEAAMKQGVTTIPYEFGYSHFVAVDAAGGTGQDSAAVCVARAVPAINPMSGKNYMFAQVCFVKEYKPKFRSSAVVEDIVAIADEYKAAKVYGDGFSGGMFASNMKDAAPHLVYEVVKDAKSIFYRKFLPLLTGQRVGLPDSKMTPIGQRIVEQLVSLEVTGEGKVDAAGGAPEDVANVVAIGCVLAATKTVSQAEVHSVTRRYTSVDPN